MSLTTPDEPDPRGQTQPIASRDRSHAPLQDDAPEAGKEVPQEKGAAVSREARNQNATAGKSCAESGTP